MPAREQNHEVARLRSLYALDMLGESADDRFEPIARLASLSLDVPVALVTLMDVDHQWFSAAHGTDFGGNVRSQSFCTHVIDDRLDVLVVEDTRLDPRFAQLPIVAGEPFVRFYAGAPIRTSNGDAVGTVCVLDVQPRTFGPAETGIIADLVEVVERELRHVEIAATDTLTGLANRRAFMKTAEGFLQMAAASGELVSVVFGDVNGLKLVNDDLGHAKGDELLQCAARVMGDTIGPADLAARVGGDEFAIVSYGSSSQDAVALIASMLAAVEEQNPTSPSGLELSISFGCATSRVGDTVESLVDRADSVMYRQKHNRIERRSTEPEPPEISSTD